jgi:hypothetical protein
MYHIDAIMTADDFESPFLVRTTLLPMTIEIILLLGPFAYNCHFLKVGA